MVLMRGADRRRGGDRQGTTGVCFIFIKNIPKALAASISIQYHHKAFSDSVTGVGQLGRVFSIFCAPVCTHSCVPRFLTEERKHLITNISHNVKTYPCLACFPAHIFTGLFYSQHSFLACHRKL